MPRKLKFDGPMSGVANAGTPLPSARDGLSHNRTHGGQDV